MSGYDKYYRSEDLFGKPFPELIRFFSELDHRGRVLDLGCGQGRNAIPLARLGYEVTGVDLSRTGIGQMLRRSALEKLPLTGIVGNMYRFGRFDEFDIILLDSMLQFGENDRERQCRLVEKIIRGIRPGGLICICLQETGNNPGILEETISLTGVGLEIMADSPVIRIYDDQISEYRAISRYRMLVLRKKQ